MRRRGWMVLLGLGALLGFGSELGHCHARHWQERRQALMTDFARTCVEAAKTPARAP